MLRTDHVSLAAHTTFKIGGTATTIFDCATIEDVQTALAYARKSRLSWYVIGGGSNLLVSDAGYDGVIICPRIMGMSFEEHSDGSVVATIGAGESWDAFVQATVEKELWGIENLADIPGSVGASPVQNIGAYGADISQTLLYCEVLDTATNDIRRLQHADCAFGYRDSIFKRDPSRIILRVAFKLSKNGTPHTSYADLATQEASGVTLDTPLRIAEAVRTIRAQKFPDLSVVGTAGSFFKNPTIATTEYARLKEIYSDLPGYASETNSEEIKVSLAWILDHVLQLKGFSIGPVRLFERQPLVLVAEAGATKKDVDSLADEVTRRVYEATDITIEREVRSL